MEPRYNPACPTLRQARTERRAEQDPAKSDSADEALWPGPVLALDRLSKGKLGRFMSPAESVRLAVRTRQLERVDGVIVVALDGRSGAGKSTLADAIARELGAAVVHGDDFYRDMPDAERRALSPAQGVDRFFDWQRLGDEALEPLRGRRPARFHCFDWIKGHGLGDMIVVEPREIVVIEGVYSARPEFEHLVDLKALVTTEDAKRTQRRAHPAGDRNRQAPEAWDAHWDAAEVVYFETIRPPGAFDLIVAGDA